MQEVWRARTLKRRKKREGAGRDPQTMHRPDKVQASPVGRFQANTAQQIAGHWPQVLTDPKVHPGGGCQLPQLLPAAEQPVLEGGSTRRLPQPHGSGHSSALVGARCVLEATGETQCNQNRVTAHLEVLLHGGW